MNGLTYHGFTRYSYAKLPRTQTVTFATPPRIFRGATSTSTDGHRILNSLQGPLERPYGQLQAPWNFASPKSRAICAALREFAPRPAPGRPVRCFLGVSWQPLGQKQDAASSLYSVGLGLSGFGLNKKRRCWNLVVSSRIAANCQHTDVCSQVLMCVVTKFIPCGRHDDKLKPLPLN